MPLYEYRCQECDHLEEVLQKVSDPAPATCPSCGKEHTMAKEVSLTSFQLKGGGWYKDLYSSVPADKGKTSESASSDATSSKSDTKAETKSKPSETASSSSSTASAPASAASTATSSASTSSPTKPSGSSPKAA